jgi:hypothetical protein
MSEFVSQRECAESMAEVLLRLNEVEKNIIKEMAVLKVKVGLFWGACSSVLGALIYFVVERLIK